MTNRYLFWFAHENLPFRLPELQSVAKMFTQSIKWLEDSKEKPFTIVECDDEEGLKKIANRTVSVRSLYQLWATATSDEELYANIQKCPLMKKAENCEKGRSFRIQVEGFGKKLTNKMKVDKIEKFSFLPFQGPIQLNNPTNSFHLIEYYGLDPNNVSDKPELLFFGKWLANGNRKVISDICLKNRKFISTTSMDPTLSLIMANLAQIKPNDVVFDPFAGSGSLLVTAAYFGGYVIGADIDFLLFHGRSKPCRSKVKQRDPDEGIRANLKQYGLESKYLDVVINDFSRPLWNKFEFDAIITDPPYGIREASKRIGSNKEYKIPDELLANHIPAKIHYNLKDIINDLLKFAAYHLKLGARLVFWIPKNREENDHLLSCSKDYLHHSCFKIITTSEQSMILNASRVLICMEKCKEPKNIVYNIPDSLYNFREEYLKTNYKKKYIKIIKLV